MGRYDRAMPITRSSWRIAARISAAVFFIAAGFNHFRSPSFYRQIVPPALGHAALLVNLSGVAEILGGFGLIIPPLRRVAGFGLLALLIAVFPANVYMCLAPQKIPDMHFPQWLLYLRLPLQAVFIAWVWFASR